VTVTGANVVVGGDIGINAAGGATITGTSTAAAGVSGVSGPHNITTNGKRPASQHQ